VLRIVLAGHAAVHLGTIGAEGDMGLEWRDTVSEIPKQGKGSTPDHRDESQPSEMEKRVDNSSSKDSQEDCVPSEGYGPSRRVGHKSEVRAWLSSLVLLVVALDGSSVATGAVSCGPGAPAVSTFLTEGEGLAVNLLLVDGEPVEGSGRRIGRTRGFVTISVATLIVTTIVAVEVVVPTVSATTTLPIVLAFVVASTFLGTVTSVVARSAAVVTVATLLAITGGWHLPLDQHVHLRFSEWQSRGQANVGRGSKVVGNGLGVGGMASWRPLLRVLLLAVLVLSLEADVSKCRAMCLLASSLLMCPMPSNSWSRDFLRRRSSKR
jgi:hypothetical protein